MNRHLVDYNAIPAPYVAAADPAKTPSQIAEELAAERARLQAEDAKKYADMTPPAPAKPREPAYQPEGFDFAYVDSKGHQGETIPARPALDPGRVTPEDVHGEPAALADVSTEWHSGPPPTVGWFNAEAAPAGMFEKLARYFDGRRWSLPVALNSKLDWKKERMEEAAGGDIEWRGPRLTGEAWPEPAAS